MALDLEDLLYDYERDKKGKPSKMWGEVIPDLDSNDGGVLGLIGSLAKIGGTVASLVPGGQVVGVPLALGGAAMEGGAKGGLSGAATGVAKEGIGQATGMGLGKLAEGLKSPVDTGSFTAYSSKGTPLTVPGIRKNPLEAFSSQGGAMTVPASPTAIGGGS